MNIGTRGKAPSPSGNGRVETLTIGLPLAATLIAGAILGTASLLGLVYYSMSQINKTAEFTQVVAEALSEDRWTRSMMERLCRWQERNGTGGCPAKLEKYEPPQRLNVRAPSMKVLGK